MSRSLAGAALVVGLSRALAAGAVIAVRPRGFEGRHHRFLARSIAVR